MGEKWKKEQCNTFGSNVINPKRIMDAELTNISHTLSNELRTT